MLELAVLRLQLSQHSHELLIHVFAAVGQEPVQDVFVEDEILLQVLDLAL